MKDFQRSRESHKHLHRALVALGGLLAGILSWIVTAYQVDMHESQLSTPSQPFTFSLADASSLLDSFSVGVAVWIVYRVACYIIRCAADWRVLMIYVCIAATAAIWPLLAGGDWG